MKTALLSIMSMFLLLGELSGEVGVASIYTTQCNGGTATASGVELKNDSYMIAHKKHPFGTVLKITNLENNKSALGIVVDRGPYIKGRIVDLTTRIANKIGLTKKKGIVKVKLEVVGKVNLRKKDVKLK